MHTNTVYNKWEGPTNGQFGKNRKGIDQTTGIKTVIKKKNHVESPLEIGEKLFHEALQYFKKQFEQAKLEEKLDYLIEETKDELRTISKIVRDGAKLNYKQFYSTELYKNIKKFKEEHHIKY